MKRIVITGATSMLGLALVHESLAQGTAVLAFVQPGSAKRALLPQSPLLQVAECALSGYSHFTYTGEAGFDVFYHFAWQATANAQRNNISAQQANIGHTLDALGLAQRLFCKRFVGAGSQAEYGRVQGAVREDMRVAPDSAYGVAKYAAGQLCLMQAARQNIECVWTRIFSTYGPNDMPSTMIMYAIDTLLRGEEPALTACEQQWDYLYSADAAHAFTLLGAKGQSGGVYNIGSGTARPLLAYVSTLRDAIDPALPLGVGKRPYAPQQVMHLCADITRLKTDTGFVPSTGFADGICQTIAWAKTQKGAQEK